VPDVEVKGWIVPALIRSIGTAWPSLTVEQPAVRDLFLAQPGLNRLGTRLVGAAFDASAVEHRHTVVPSLVGGNPDEFVDAAGLLGSPSTGYRNDRYRDHAPDLFVAAARNALERSGLGPEDVTHLVTVSCTGFTQPGPDVDIVHALGLRGSVFRHHIGFMGCAAAFPALRIAAAFCSSDAAAVVLVVCAELCTLHVRSSSDPDQIVSNSVFGDGAAAAVVTAEDSSAPVASGRGLRIGAFSTSLVAEGAPDMAWNIGDEGFEMILSTRIPKLVQDNVSEAIEPVLRAMGREPGDIRTWAVHPGGRAILDRVEQTLSLPQDGLRASRETLRDHGNMSSATILFVLERILRDEPEAGEPVIALAFGPGLTVETAALEVA
jgi:predicted naringenin-chalcone synthase